MVVRERRGVSVPSSGDYQFLRTISDRNIVESSFRPLIRGLSISSRLKRKQTEKIEFPSPHPGIINFFPRRWPKRELSVRFRPLIRGLSISSPRPRAHAHAHAVSVPSSGDYQFLRVDARLRSRAALFPSPHPGIINFFPVATV